MRSMSLRITVHEADLFFWSFKKHYEYVNQMLGSLALWCFFGDGIAGSRGG